MRITVGDLSARRFEIDHPDALGRARVAGVEYLTEVGGSIERDADTVNLRPLQLKECQVSGLDWHLRKAHISLGTPATLAALKVEGIYSADLAKQFPFEGSVAVGSLDAERVKVELPSRRLSFDLRSERALVTLSESEGGHVAGTGFALSNLQTSIGNALVRANRASGQTARLAWHGDETLFEAATASLHGLVVQTKEFEVEIDQVEFPRGITIRDGRIEARELVVGKAQVFVHDLYALATDRAADPEEPRHDDGSTYSFRDLDRMLLDQLHGQLDVDLTVDATFPVIGRRRATHHFRVPIEHGTINYRELERDLARLEDAVIDFSVRDVRLVLERDVPLIPGLHKPLVLWPLSDVELALAKKRVVRLRSLLAYQLPEKSAEDAAEEKSRVNLRSLDFENISVAVALLEPPDEGAEPSTAPSGPVPHATLGDLRVMGFLRHSAHDDPDAGAVTATAGALDATVRQLRLGRVQMAAQSARLDAIEEATLSFEGLRPRRLAVTLRGLRLTDASLTL